MNTLPVEEQSASALAVALGRRGVYYERVGSEQQFAAFRFLYSIAPIPSLLADPRVKQFAARLNF